MSKLTKTEKFIKNEVHYLKEFYDSGTTVIHCDPDFQKFSPELIKPPLPPLSSTDQKLDFIIDELHLKDRFS